MPQAASTWKICSRIMSRRGEEGSSGLIRISLKLLLQLVVQMQQQVF
jgi:hypothetical protein